MQNIYGSKLLTILKHDCIQNKYTKWYCSIIEKSCIRYMPDYNIGLAQNRRNAAKVIGYIEAHHILPKSIYKLFANDIDNIVYVTAREHFILHLLLIKMFKGKERHQMEFAFRRMQHCQSGQRYTSRLIEYLRPNIPPANAGKKHITDGTNTRYYPKNLPLPEGWYYGTGTMFKINRQRLNDSVHQKMYQITYQNGSIEVIENLASWAETVGIPYPTLTSAAQHNSLVRNKFRIKKLDSSVPNQKLGAQGAYSV
jgi:hypothetical protein